MVPAALGHLTRSEINRFWSKVDTSGGADACWLWTGGLRRTGYGVFWLRDRPHHAHRVADVIVNGPIAAGVLSCHTCDVRRCCNPRHLFRGSQYDNMRDMAAKGRAGRSFGARNGNYTHPERNPARLYPERHRVPAPKRGEANHRAKLTEAAVRAIRLRAASGEMKTKLAAEFGISLPVISRIVSRQRWAHVL